MDKSKNTSLLSTISGLALCGFMAACNKLDTPSDAPPQLDRQEIKDASLAIKQTVVKMAFDLEATKTKPSEIDCQYMKGSLELPVIQKDKSPDVNRVRDMVRDQCPK